MILYDMDYPTIFRQMFAESEKVDYYLNKNVKKVIAQKQGKHIEPYIYYDIVTMKDTNNKYLLYWYITDPEAVYFSDTPMKEKYMLKGAILLLNDKKGSVSGIVYRRYKTYETTGNMRLWLTDNLFIFTPHFFSRYRERFNLEPTLSVLDVIGIFSARNLNYFSQLDYNKLVLEKNKIPNGQATAIKDGVMLGEEEHIVCDNHPVIVIRNRTFLGDPTLKMSQRESVPTKEQTQEIANKLFSKYYGYEIDTIL